LMEKESMIKQVTQWAPWRKTIHIQCYSNERLFATTHFKKVPHLPHHCHFRRRNLVIFVATNRRDHDPPTKPLIGESELSKQKY
jgi:hypothetical protein